jgi:hypothetical protein
MKNVKKDDLFNWCLEQAAAKYMGTLDQEKIDKLNALEFPWSYYEEELDKLGFHWAKNSPTGKDERAVK